MVYRNTTIRGPAAIYQTEEGAAPLAREAGRRPPKGQQGLLIITLIALLTKTIIFSKYAHFIPLSHPYTAAWYALFHRE